MNRANPEVKPGFYRVWLTLLDGSVVVRDLPKALVKDRLEGAADLDDEEARP